jgi:hypothetical protein
VGAAREGKGPPCDEADERPALLLGLREEVAMCRKRVHQGAFETIFVAVEQRLQQPKRGRGDGGTPGISDPELARSRQLDGLADEGRGSSVPSLAATSARFQAN